MIKLNLGCKYDYREGYVNVDICKKMRADMYFDLNKTPYPLESDSIDEIILQQTLEHLDNIKALTEIYRICKHGAIIKIEVPFDSVGFNHIQHTRCYNWSTFRNMTAEYLPFKFELIKQEPSNRQKKGIGKLRKYIPFKRALSYFFPIVVKDMYVELRVIKEDY